MNHTDLEGYAFAKTAMLLDANSSKNDNIHDIADTRSEYYLKICKYAGFFEFQYALS